MKKLSVNRNDCSFENKKKFEDLLNNIKAFGKSIKKNGKQTCFFGILMGCVILSSYNIYKSIDDLFSLRNYDNIWSSVNSKTSSNNDQFIEDRLSDSILVANIQSTVKQEYYFKDNYLYDNDGNIINLKGVEKSLYFIRCQIDEETFKNIQLSSSLTKNIGLDVSNLDNNFINYLPITLEHLSLDKCNCITNLNSLSERCPNLKYLSINAAASLQDLSFIYKLSNLEEIYISDSAYVTEELINYLKERGITTNLTEQDVINTKKINQIINSITTKDMSDKSKVQAICLYVLDNLEYDITKLKESNGKPLNCALVDGKCVCASYAYLTNILLNKAGIKSYEITNHNHAWNLIELDEKYYYIDTTNMDGNYFFNLLLRAINITRHYMVDTDITFNNVMSRPTYDTTNIPMSLVNEIEFSRNRMDFFEKNSALIVNTTLFIGDILKLVLLFFGPTSLFFIIQNIPDLFCDIKHDYYKEKYIIKINKR